MSVNFSCLLLSSSSSPSLSPPPPPPPPIPPRNVICRFFFILQILISKVYAQYRGYGSMEETVSGFRSRTKNE